MRRSIVAILAFLLVAGPAFAATPSRRTPVVDAVERVGPAVVNVSTTQIVERQLAPSPMWQDPFFDQFFRDFFEPRRQRFTQSSLGSGILIRKDGYVLTNQHVVLRASKITITLADERDFEAHLVGSDADSDLAVLKLTTDGPLPAVEMGHSDDLMIGETVIAIGNPFGLSHTVTTGVVSAVGRSVRAQDQVFYDLIQTDASINPGNSGGPLLNIRGELIGINSAIYQNAQGIGFAIPIDRARRVVADLITYGEVQPGWVGISVQALTPDLARHFGSAGRTGVLVTAIESDSPAQSAGIQRGDLILSVDDRPVHSADEWESRLRDAPIGSTLHLSLQRDGRSRVVTVVARHFPSARADRLTWRLLGLRLAEHDGALRVAAVRRQSPADRVGIREGDVISALAGRPVHTMEEFRLRMVKNRHAQRVLVSVRRGPHLYQVPLPLAR
jgi:serine protease Do